ncbi:hypothetical protein PR001_g13013 [Phytophthora rubi]|uniref:Uncharacterized protein n=2 Tax=Phytophthora rubi TaxID=129364 RepID=A0A6A3LY10_9STRA|nr:hypothetical protein PR001_g13013 [Phytophthora rubi]
MERRQQSGDGGTWQAPAIPATAEFEGRRAVVATERVAADTADTDVTESTSALTATVGKGNDRRVVIDTHAVLEALGVRNGGAPTQEELDANVLGQLQAVMRLYGGDEAGDGRRSMDDSPEALQAALQDEQERRDKRETASAGVADAAPRGNANHGEGAVVGFKRDPTEEDKKLREALDWSTQAAQSLSQAEARVQPAKEGCVALAENEVGQCEKVTGEDTVNEDAVREKVAQQLEMAATGLDIGGKGAAAAMDKVELRRSRTRRRYEKRLRKALAMERRELDALVTAYPYPKQAYYVFEEVHRRFSTAAPRVLSRSETEVIGFMLPSATEVLQGRGGRRRSGRQYAYHSGSVYAHPYMEQVGAKQRQYEQHMVVDALIVEGAATEFLLGGDWMLAKGVKIDYTACEMKWYEAETKKVVPFQCTKNGGTNDKLAKVRLVRRAKVQTQTCRNVELAVAAPEGTVGIFTPARRVEPHLLLAPTLTTVRGGKVVVPILNLVGRMSKLPSREVLGTWAPTAQDMTVLEMTGEFGRDKVR